MRSTPRSAAVFLGLLPAALAGQRTQPAQRGGPAGPDTRRVLIATFASTDRQLGVEASNELRQRAQDKYPARQLFVVTKPEMDRTLNGSGFPADSALAITDVMELGRNLRADYVVDGVARKTADGVVVEPRLQLKRGDIVLTQPLSTIAAKNLGDVTKIVLKSLDDVLNAMPSYLACEAELRAGRYDAAASNARATIAAYGGSTFGRLCLLSAFTYGKAPADSILRVANEILEADSLSMIALTNAFDASMARGDTAAAVRYGTRAWRINRSNRAVLVLVVNGLVSLGRLDEALGLIKEALDFSPDDAGLVKTRMQLLLRLRRYKDAMAAGDSLARLDPASVTAEFIGRMAAAAALDSQPELAVKVYERGVARFPSDAEMHLSYAQALARTGKLVDALAAAQRAVTLKPDVENGYLFVLSYQLQLSQFDSALASAPRAIAAGAAKDKIADALVAAILPGVVKAQSSRLRDDWQAALAVAQRVDKIAPSQGSKFYIGFSAYNVGTDAVTVIGELNQQLKGARPAAQKDLRSKACAEAKVAEDNFATASISIAAGGGYDKDTAAKLMLGLQQSGEFVSQAKGLFCK